MVTHCRNASVYSTQISIHATYVKPCIEQIVFFDGFYIMYFFIRHHKCIQPCDNPRVDLSMLYFRYEHCLGMDHKLTCGSSSNYFFLLSGIFLQETRVNCQISLIMIRRWTLQMILKLLHKI